MMKRHGLHEGIWKTPQTQEIRTDFCVMRFHCRHVVFGRGLIRFRCGPRGEHDLTYVMQDTREKGLICLPTGEILGQRDSACPRSGLQTVLP
jgi:hypothetical protein